jgi:hypothetical protein
MYFRSSDLLRLVRDFGETLTLKKTTTTGTYDPTTGGVSGSATTDYSFTGYIYNATSEPIDQIVKDMRRCVIPALGLAVEPTDEDTIVRGSTTYVINHVTIIFSNGTAICYLCHLED